MGLQGKTVIQVTSHFSMSDLPVDSTPTAAETKVAMHMTNKRHLSWLSRNIAKGGGVAWRPKNFYRRGTVKWLIEVDNIRRSCTADGGLAFFVRDPVSPTWALANWRLWPTLTALLDQGPKCISGTCALQYKESVRSNWSVIYEFSHGCNNDFNLTMKELDKFALMLILLIILNISHGPDKDEGMRYEQFREMLRKVADVMDPKTFVLFQARSARMCAELDGQFEVDPALGPALSLWKFIQENIETTPMHERIKMCRYLDWWSGAKALLSRWTLELFKHETLALEEDWLKGGKFLALPSVKAADVAHNDAVTSTSSTITAIEAKLLRSSCLNNVVTGLAALGQYDIKRDVAHMVLFTEPLKVFQGKGKKH